MQRPWDTIEYQGIMSAAYRGGKVVLIFADGSEVRLSPQLLVSPEKLDADWPHLRAEEFHLVVPSPTGEIEIPWDILRVHSDPAFDAFWAELAAEPVASRAAVQIDPDE